MMNALGENSWLDKFLLVRYIRRLEEDVNRHKWYESERAGHDIGWDNAVVDWTVRISRRYFREHPRPSRRRNSRRN
jgi:hypothetical protein